MLYSQGFQSEVSGILGHITRWDVCRYLKKTFSYALNRVQPDVVIMLGKLTPEPWWYGVTSIRQVSIWTFVYVFYESFSNSGDLLDEGLVASDEQFLQYKVSLHSNAFHETGHTNS
jgi:hypothetical protein